MKNFLSSIAENWKILSEVDNNLDIDFSAVDQAAEKTAVNPNVFEDFSLDDVEDF